MKKIDVSVIIVNYHVEKELLDCIASIKQSEPQVSYEIIVVDNDEEKTIDVRIKEKFPQVKYIANAQNTGWGGGINTGAEKAKGEYLFFLNPDTVIKSNVIDILFDFFQKHPNVGIVSAQLFNGENKPFLPLGSKELTPFRAAVVYSFINKVFPRNLVSRDFYYLNEQRGDAFEVEIAPLAASMVSRKLFENVGKFDSKLFLYFEEYDFGRRVRKLGYHNFILSKAKVIHYWERSTTQLTNRNLILEQSRKYYLIKYFSGFSARIVEVFLHRNLKKLVVE